MRSNFQDKHSQLSTSLTDLPDLHMQNPDKLFAHHIDDIVRVYRFHNAKLTPACCITVFGGTHCTDTLGFVFHTVARKHVLEQGITET